MSARQSVRPSVRQSVRPSVMKRNQNCFKSCNDFSVGYPVNEQCINSRYWSSSSNQTKKKAQMYSCLRDPMLLGCAMFVLPWKSEYNSEWLELYALVAIAKVALVSSFQVCHFQRKFLANSTVRDSKRIFFVFLFFFFF